MTPQAKSIFQSVVNAISEVTGIEKTDINMDSYLEEDLGIDFIEAFPQIMKFLNEQLESQLPLRNPEFVRELKMAETVADLVDRIEAELEF